MGKEKKEKKPKRKITKLERFSTFLLVMTILITVILFFLSISPFAIILFGLALGMLYGILVVVCTICSIGTVWVIEPFNQFCNFMNEFLLKCFNQDPSTLIVMKQISIYVIITGAVFLIGGLVLDVIKFGQNKKLQVEKNPYKGKMIAQIIVSAIFLALAIIVVVTPLSS